MNTSLSHLSASRRQQIQSISSVIVQLIDPEKIFLFGIYGIDGGVGSGLLAETHFSGLMGGYDLLVVTRREERRSDFELQDIMEGRCRAFSPITVLSHDIDYVNARLSEGHYFFTMIRRDAILLYDAGHVPLAEGVMPDLGLIRKTAQHDFERWRRQSRAFFQSALFNRSQQEPNIAIFLLHQAAEHIYQAILLAFTGYKPCTHNLDKLRRYTNRFSIELAFLFPRNSAEEDHLFILLLKGYVEARYKEEYTITAGELDLITTRIESLLSIADRVCRNRFISLGKMAASI
jgi:HEPN domain-containing protein